MVQLDAMKGLVTAYIASPKGQEAIRNFLSSPEGQKAIDHYLSSPEGQEMAQIFLCRALDGTTVSADVREQILRALQEKKISGK